MLKRTSDRSRGVLNEYGSTVNAGVSGHTPWLISGLLFAYDIATLGLAEGANVTALKDTGPNGLGARAIVPGTYAKAGLNNTPAVRFHTSLGSYYYLPNMAGLTAGEIFIAVKVDSDPPPTTARTGLWDISTSTEGFPDTHFPYTDNSIYDGAFSTIRKNAGNPTPSMTSPIIYNVSSATNSWTARINGSVQHTTGTNTVGFPSAPLLGKGRNAFSLDGYIGFVAMFTRVLTTGERTAITDELMARYV